MKITSLSVLTLGLLAGPALADKRLDEAVARAEDQFQKGRADEALKTLQRVVSQQPGSPEAHLALARLQQRAGSMDDAAASVAKAVELSASAPAPVRAEALAELSAMDLRRGSGRDAVAHAGEAVKLEATAKTLAALARAQARAQDAATALQTAQKAAAAGGGAAALEAEGEALLAAGRNDEAAAAFRKALAADPKMALARVRLASALLAQGKAAEAAAEARKATEEDPKSPEAFAVLGTAILTENPKNWSDAIAQAQQGAFLDPRSPSVQVAVGKIFEANGNLDQAVAAYKRAVEVDPANVAARKAVISLQERRGDLEGALAEARKLVAEAPQSGEAQLQLGRILLRKSDYAAAAPALQQAAAFSPGVAEAHALLGMAFQYTRKTPEALAAYKRATELSPGNLEYRTTYGLLLGVTGQHDAGVAELKKVIASPGYKDVAAYANLGYIYRNMKRTDDAIAAYRKAMEIDPRNEQVVLGLARSLFNASRLDEAIAMYQKLMQVDPDFAGEANIGLAWSYLFKNDLAQARAYTQKAQAQLAGDPRIAQLQTNIEKVEKGLAAERAQAEAANDEPPAPRRAGPDVGTLSDTVMRGADPATRRRAARQLASMGPQGVPALIHALSDKDEGVREAAVASLGALGPAAKQAIPYLNEILRTRKIDKTIMTPEEMKQAMREEDFRRAVRDALLKIQG